MKQLKKGTSLLLVLLTISFVSLIATTVWKTTLYGFEVTILRAHENQRMWTGDSILNIGISIATENYDVFLERGEAIVIPIDDWLSQATNGSSSSLELAPHQNQIRITALIKDSKGTSKTFKCSVSQQFDNKNDKPFFVIENWHSTASKL